MGDNAYHTEDLSVFRTKRPRPTSTLWHLAMAAFSFVLAILAALCYAEN